MALNCPQGVAFDAAGNLFIADGNGLIRKVMSNFSVGLIVK